MRKLLDTSAAKRIEYDDKNIYIITEQVKQEFEKYRFPTSEYEVIQVSTWTNFQKFYSDKTTDCFNYKLTCKNTTDDIQIIRYKIFKYEKALCGKHNIFAEIYYKGLVFNCCKNVCESEADFSQIIATIQNPEIEVETRDRCLGKTCKFIRQKLKEIINNFDEQR